MVRVRLPRVLSLSSVEPHRWSRWGSSLFGAAISLWITLWKTCWRLADQRGDLCLQKNFSVGRAMHPMLASPY